MKLFYCCYGSAHSSVTAANIHLGHLPLDRRPSLAEILHQPLFDRAEDGEIGDPFYMGRDEQGHEIYILGLAGAERTMTRALERFLRDQGIDLSAIRFIDVLQHAGSLMRVGGFTSRRLGWVAIGRPLCALGVYLKYPLFAAHVRRIREELDPASFLDVPCGIRHNG
jgi:hypothetical protein